MRVVEARGRRIGWNSIVSDTTDNAVSANNFILAGYRLFEPDVPWGLVAYALLAEVASLRGLPWRGTRPFSHGGLCTAAQSRGPAA
jgi:hypothetical protein